jgi:FKBP-type peptidyl-prolyl cis-trans isomerase
MRVLLVPAIGMLFGMAGIFGVSGCEKLGKLTQKPVKLNTDEDKVSYAIGQQIGGSIKAQGVAINTAILAASIDDAKSGKPSLMTPEEIRETMTKMQQGLAAKQEQAGKDNIVAGAKFLEENKKKPTVKVTASGLQYEVVQEGKGPTPSASDTVKVHYSGTLTDGTKFDSSYDRKEPAEFPVGGVIKGWTEALQLMNAGAKFKLAIPSDLAYGPQGRPGIPPNSVLVFEVELLEIKAPGAAPEAPPAPPATAPR